LDSLVNIDVDDLSKAIAFYCKAARLRRGRRFGSFGVEMLGTSSAIYLLLKPDGTKPSTNTDEMRRYRPHEPMPSQVLRSAAIAPTAISSSSRGRWRIASLRTQESDDTEQYESEGHHRMVH
jgi:hypothetical protein